MYLTVRIKDFCFGKLWFSMGFFIELFGKLRLTY